jgi:hypothetical protein
MDGIHPLVRQHVADTLIKRLPKGWQDWRMSQLKTWVQRQLPGNPNAGEIAQTIALSELAGGAADDGDLHEVYV